jgi:type VI secretion system secreted protein VgrG
MTNERNIKITTPLGPDVLLFERMEGHETLGMPFDYKVTLSSLKPDLDLSALLGQTATVEVAQSAGGMRYFNGYVTSFSYVGSSGDYARYEMNLRPWFWLLSLGSNCRIFQNKTVPDIVKQVWREAGFTDFRESLTGSYRTWTYSVQYRESDFNYTSRLLEQEGIYYFFEHNDGKHTLVLADSVGAHAPAPNYETIPYYPPHNSDRRKRDHLSTWSVGRQMRPGGYATTDYDFTKPKADLTAKLQMPAAHSLASFETFEYPGEYLTSADGQTQVKVRLEANQADYEVGSAGGNVMGLGVGALFTLSLYPREDQNQEYLIVSARYHLDTNAYESGSGQEEEFEGQYTLIPSKTPYRPRITVHKPRVDGPQTALVVGKKGEEIWTDKYGRIKVQFPWDREGKGDENSSCWVRVAQSWAGARWGSIYTPRIGQEVIVHFLEGDPDRPIVVGQMYNADQMPPYDLTTHQTQSGIKTRSTKSGSPDNFNEIRFEDKKGAEDLHIQAEKDQTTLIKHNQTITVTNQLTETYGGGRETTVQKFDDTTVKGGNKNITVEQQYNLMADVLNLKAKSDIFIQVGSAIIHIDKTGNITLQGATIKLNSP